MSGFTGSVPSVLGSVSAPKCTLRSSPDSDAFKYTFEGNGKPHRLGTSGSQSDSSAGNSGASGSLGSSSLQLCSRTPSANTAANWAPRIENDMRPNLHRPPPELTCGGACSRP